MNYLHNPEQDDLTFLIMDDNPNDRALIKRELQKEFKAARFLEPTEEKEFVAILKSAEFDMVVTDFKLNWIDGLDIVDRIKSIHPHIPVIMFTATGNEEIAVDALKLGVDDYILKSTRHYKSLRGAIKNALQRGEDRLRRKQAEEALKEREKHFKELWDNAPVAYHILDKQGIIRQVNQTEATLLGYTPEEMIGKPIFDFISPVEKKAAQEHFKQKIKTKKLDQFSHRTFVKKDGNQIHFSIDDKIEKDPEGNIVGIRTAMTDITDLIKLKEKLNRQISAMEASIDGIAILNASEKYEYINHSHAHIYGYSDPQELKGKSWRILYGPEETRRFENSIMPQFRQDGQWRGEAVGTKKDGRTFPQEVSLTGLPDGGLICVVRDISKRKEIENKLQKINRLYALISQVNQIIVRADNRKKLFQDICQICIHYGKFKLAWIGISDKENQTINPAAAYGHDQKYLYHFHVSVKKGTDGHYIRQKLHQDKYFISNNILKDQQLKKWHPIAKEAGLNSYAAVPLKCGQEFIGVLNLYAAEVNFFDAEELNLIKEVALDISYAIDRLEAERQRKKAEVQLQSVHKIYQKTIENARGVPYSFNYDEKNYTFMGQGIEDLLEISPANFSQQKMKELVQNITILDQRKHVDPQKYTQLFRTGEIERYRSELEVRTSSGHKKWLADFALPIKDPETGKVTGSMGILQDITERKKAEQELKKSEERFRKMAENIQDGLTIIENGKVVYMNNRILEIFGYPYAELKHLQGWDLAAPEEKERLKNLYKDIKKSGEIPPRVEFWINRKDGTRRFIQNRYSRPSDGEKTSTFYIITTDITERKQAEEDREKLQRQLVQSQKMEAVGTLSGGAAHDFNNILTIIQGNAEMALMKFDPADPMYTILDQIVKASSRAARLTKQLLLYSRKEPMDFVGINLNETIERLVHMFHRVIEENIDIKTHLQSKLECIHADENKIEQVITNMIINAKDAMPKGGTINIGTQNVCVDEEYTRQYSYARPGQFVCLYIEDTGTGMDKNTVKRIFDPFFTTKGRAKGTGLGLSVAYGIIKEHAGWINVYSEPGKGTTFKIYIPAAKTSQKQTDDQKLRTVKNLQGDGEGILIVEDEETVLNFIANVLSENGYTVFKTTHPTHARKIFQKNKDKIDILLCDVIMPEMDGFDLTKSLTKEKADLKVILCSGYSEDMAQKAKAKAIGYQFLQKPFKVNQLLRVVKLTTQEK